MSLRVNAISKITKTLALSAIFLMGTGCTFDGEAASVAADTHGSASQQLRFYEVSVPTKPGVVFQKLELQFLLDAPYQNPFDPDDIKVDALVTTPDGQVVTVPAFFLAPYRSSDGETWLEGGVSYVKTGEPRWVVRYTPTVAGKYRIQLVAEKPGANDTAPRIVKTEPYDVFVAPGDGLGFVQQSADNPLYFVNSGDGSLFYPVGVNIPWTRRGDPVLGKPYASMDYYLRKASGNMTSTRVWMAHWAWLEWTPGLNPPSNSSWSGYAGIGRYNQMVAAAFDRVFELAEQYGLRIMLALDDNDEHDKVGKARSNWVANPYNQTNGGPCSEPSCVFTSPEARRAYRNRLRYIVARWGYSTSLWALNSWNDYSTPDATQVAWTKEMRDYVHSLTDPIRPIFYGVNFRFDAQAISDYAQAEKGSLVPGKPNVIQEVYYTQDEKWFLRTLQYELWTNVARGRSGVMVWPHHIVDKLNIWSPVFRTIADFVQALPLHEKYFQPIEAKVVAVKYATAGTIGSGQGSNSQLTNQPVLKTITLNRYGDVPDWGVKATRDTWDIYIGEANHFLEGFGVKLYGQRTDRLAWRTTPTFNINLPGPGKLMVRIDEVSGTVPIRVRNHGAVVYEKVYSGAGRRKPTGADEYVVVPLPPGPNSLTLSADGPCDWAGLGQIYFVYEEPDPAKALEVYGLSSGEEAMLYVANPTYGEVFQKVMGGREQPFQDVVIEVAGFQSGTYTVEIVNVSSGSVTWRGEAKSVEGLIAVSIPRLEQGAAVRVIRSSTVVE